MYQCPDSSAAKLGFEDAIFLVHRGDDPLLVTLDPPDEHGKEHVEDHGFSSEV
jgi:hypothetical protein